MALALLSLLLPAEAQEGWIAAPGANNPVDQRDAGPTTCGPAALLDAFQSAHPRWHKSLAPYRKLDSDEKKIREVIRRHGLRPSAVWGGQIRWRRNGGVNLIDLGQMAREMRRGFSTSKLRSQLLFIEKGESRDELLQRTHGLLKKSLQKGFPPVISVKRVVNRYLPKSGNRMWLNVQGHFVTVTGVPNQLTLGADSFRITYHDPWGGRALQGHLRIPQTEFWAKPVNSRNGLIYRSPNLVADFPNSRIGTKRVRRGEKTALTLSGAVGAL